MAYQNTSPSRLAVHKFITNSLRIPQEPVAPNNIEVMISRPRLQKEVIVFIISIMKSYFMADVTMSASLFLVKTRAVVKQHKIGLVELWRIFKTQNW